jgi:phage-related protein
MSTPLPLTNRLRPPSRTRTQRIQEIQLGDGYREVTVDGINANRDLYSNVGWDHLNSTERATAVAFLSAVGSVGYVSWTPHGGSPQRFRVTTKGWTETWSSGIHSNISFDLQEE